MHECLSNLAQPYFESLFVKDDCFSGDYFPINVFTFPCMSHNTRVITNVWYIITKGHYLHVFYWYTISVVCICWIMLTSCDMSKHFCMSKYIKLTRRRWNDIFSLFCPAICSLSLLICVVPWYLGGQCAQPWLVVILATSPAIQMFEQLKRETWSCSINVVMAVGERW